MYTVVTVPVGLILNTATAPISVTMRLSFASIVIPKGMTSGAPLRKVVTVPEGVTSKIVALSSATKKITWS